MNMCPHKDLHNSTGRNIVHGCPKQKCCTCSSPDEERIVVYPKGVLQSTRPNSRLRPSTKKGLYTAEVCLGRLRQEWKRGGRRAGRGQGARAWLRKVTVTRVLGQQQDQWGQRQVEGTALCEAVACRSVQQEVWRFWSGVRWLGSICLWPSHKGPAF